MDEFDTSVMIALLPTTTDWCKIDLPHLTLVYAGQILDLPVGSHNDMAKVALDLSMACEAVPLKVMGPDVFGDEEKVDVLRLELSPQLAAMRARVENWNASQHPFNPHVTVGPVGSLDKDYPFFLVFDRIAVVWGSDQLTYKLRSPERTKT